MSLTKLSIIGQSVNENMTFSLFAWLTYSHLKTKMKITVFKILSTITICILKLCIYYLCFNSGPTLINALPIE